MNLLKRALLLFCTIIFWGNICNAEQASVDFLLEIPAYTKITPVTSPVLIANITDRTGNLQAPLSSKFKVITNSVDTKTLFLQANIITEAGNENAIYQQGGRVYIAFGSLTKIPKSSSLANCKYSADPKSSPGIVAYPITSIVGAEHKYIPAKEKYEVYAKTGVSYIAVNIGTNVNRTSFSRNDPRGFYQAILSLTEADI